MRALGQAVDALKEAQKPKEERETVKVEEGTLSTRLRVHEARGAAIDSIRQTASVLEAVSQTFEEDGFTQRLLKTYDKHRQQVESAVERALQGWTMRRLTAEDGAALRLGATELIYFTDVPPKVIINEYVELAKRYGADDAEKFVNGVLDRVMREHPREETK